MKKPIFEKSFTSLGFTPANDMELKAIGDNRSEGFVAGWASTPAIDCYNHSVAPDAFVDSIKSRGLRGPTSVKFFIDHSASKVAGHITKLDATPRGTWIEAEFNLNISYVKDHYEAAKSIGGMNFSVGFMPEEAEEKTYKGDAFWHITKGDLMEVSSVAIPANDTCHQLILKTKDIEELDLTADTMAQFEKLLIANGFAPIRTRSHELVKLIKSNSHLFKQLLVEDPALPKTSPVEETLKKLQRQLAEMKSV